MLSFQLTLKYLRSSKWRPHSHCMLRWYLGLQQNCTHFSGYSITNLCNAKSFESFFIGIGYSTVDTPPTCIKHKRWSYPAFPRHAARELCFQFRAFSHALHSCLSSICAIRPAFPWCIHQWSYTSAVVDVYRWKHKTGLIAWKKLNRWHKGRDA